MVRQSCSGHKEAFLHELSTRFAPGMGHGHLTELREGEELAHEPLKVQERPRATVPVASVPVPFPPAPHMSVGSSVVFGRGLRREAKRSP